MKIEEYSNKYRRIDRNKTFDRSSFVDDLFKHFLEMMDRNNGHVSVRKFYETVKFFALKYNKITSECFIYDETIWEELYNGKINDLKYVLFEEEREKKEKLEREKEARLEERRRRERVKREREERQARKKAERERRRRAEDRFRENVESLLNSKPSYSFNILNISQDSTIQEVKKAYKKLALKHHPDRGGNQAEFVKITDAKDKCIEYLESSS